MKKTKATVVDYAAGGVRRMFTEQQVLEITKFSSVTLWRRERDGLFPRRHHTSPNRVIWFEDEIVAWQNDIQRQRHRRPPPDKS